MGIRNLESDGKHTPSRETVTKDLGLKVDHAFGRMVEGPKGEKLVRDQASYRFDELYGDQVDQLGEDAQELNSRFERSSQALKDLEARRDKTERFIEMSKKNGGHKDADVPWKEWNLQDKIVSLSAGSMAIIALIMGVVNVVINLQESGVPTFIEHPWMAFLLALIVPAGAMAIKFGYNFLDNDRARKQYAWGVYVSACVSILIWSGLFAMSFHGVSAGVDWDSLGEGGGSSHGSSLLVWFQIIAEIMVGAALFLVVEHCFARYSSSYYVENLEWLEVKKALDSHLQAHEKLRDERNAVRGRLSRLLAKRNKYINEAVAEFLSQ